MSQLEEIKARAEGATEGPWQVWDDKPAHRSAYVETAWSVDGESTEPITGWCTPKDAEFIAHARTDVPKLIAALEAVEAVISEHEARTPFPDADKESQWYSLGKQHGYERVQLEITEALQ